MSGIAALLERDGAHAAEGRIASMSARLAHRGPDGRTHLCLGPAALAHARLETTPEDGLAEEPLAASSAPLWISADARLDNRKALLEARRVEGEPDLPLSDAALILWAYQRWGRNCPSRLLGDFAFVIWDKAARLFFCARDHLGVRPLYYHADGRSFRAASEMYALFADDRVPRCPDEHSMALFLTGQYTEARETLWAGILALPAGHHLTVTARSLCEERYWQPDPARRIRYHDNAPYAEHFREIFREAVRCRLRSGHQLAAQVSGGLDSSSVACMAEKVRRSLGSGEALILQRCCFPGLECDERSYSQAVASHLDLPIETFNAAADPPVYRPTSEQVAQDSYYDPTVRVLAPLVESAKRRGVRTTLTGVGGDLLLRRTGVELASELRPYQLLRAARLCGPAMRPSPHPSFRSVVSSGIEAYIPPRVVRPLRWIRRPPSSRWPWVTPRVARAAAQHQEALAQRLFERIPDPVARNLAAPFECGAHISLPLALIDRFGARFGAEFRHPFFDVRLVELLLAFPHDQRYDGDIEKPVLRRAMGKDLPDLVRERRQITYFTSYVHTCLFGEQRASLRHLLGEGLLVQAAMLSHAEVVRLLDDSGEDDVSPLLHSVALEIWFRNAVGTDVPNLCSAGTIDNKRKS